MSGGYQIIDLNYIKLVQGTQVPVPGIFEKVRKAIKNGKFLVFTRLNCGGVIRSGAFVVGCDDPQVTYNFILVQINAPNATIILELTSNDGVKWRAN